MNRFPLDQLTGGALVTLTPPPGATIRRHILQDDTSTRPENPRTKQAFARPSAPKRLPPKPRTQPAARKLITQHAGRPSTNQRVLDALANGEAMTSVELRQRTGLSKEYIYRSTCTLLDHKLIRRTGVRRMYVYSLK